jgi:hypothetical protein
MKLTYIGVRLYTNAMTGEAVIIIRRPANPSDAEHGMRSTSTWSVLDQVRHYMKQLLRR